MKKILTIMVCALLCAAAPAGTTIRHAGGTTYINSDDGLTTIKRYGNITYINSPGGNLTIQQLNNITYINSSSGLATIKRYGNTTYINGNAGLIIRASGDFTYVTTPTGLSLVCQSIGGGILCS